MEFKPLTTTRPPVMGRQQAVVAGHYLAALAGMRILDRGGNAVDAGVAAGLCLNVLQPDMTNLGGVAPIMVRLASGEIATISGLGTWPRAVSVDLLRQRGGGRIPRGILSTVVPSAVDAWITALERFGTLSFGEVASAAIELCERGFPVHQFLHDNLKAAAADLLTRPYAASIYAPAGRVPAVGEILVQPDYGRTLRRLAEAESAAVGDRRAKLRAARDRFYRGDIAREIAAFHREAGGLLTEADLAEFAVEVEAPVSTTYRGATVYACNVWCQGPVVLETLNILEGYEIARLERNGPEHLHLVVEALKASFADRHHYYGDPRCVEVPVAGLLSKEYAAAWRARISHERAADGMPEPGDAWAYAGREPSLAGPGRPTPAPGPLAPDTSYCCAVDRDGNAFSATPSDGVTGTPVVPGLGIVTSPRGVQSWLDPAHPACVAPGKRPRLTPSPGMVVVEGEFVMPYGTPGNDVQPQAMTQFVLNVVDFGLDPQAAIEAPRVATYSFPATTDPHPYNAGLLRTEGRLSPDTIDALARLGHRVQRWPDWIPTAGALGAIRAERGRLIAGADPRRITYALAW